MLLWRKKPRQIIAWAFFELIVFGIFQKLLTWHEIEATNGDACVVTILVTIELFDCSFAGKQILHRGVGAACAVIASNHFELIDRDFDSFICHIRKVIVVDICLAVREQLRVHCRSAVSRW